MTKSLTTQVGQPWSIVIDAKVDVDQDGHVLVDFAAPAGGGHTVSATPNGQGLHVAVLTMTEAGKWTATVRVPGQDPEGGYTATVSDPDAAPAKPRNIDVILADVGDDKDKAQAELDLEQARGDDARKTLVEQLQALVNPAG